MACLRRSTVAIEIFILRDGYIPSSTMTAVEVNLFGFNAVEQQTPRVNFFTGLDDFAMVALSLSLDAIKYFVGKV
jgi:hypothetical protein